MKWGIVEVRWSKDGESIEPAYFYGWREEHESAWLECKLRAELRAGFVSTEYESISYSVISPDAYQKYQNMGTKLVDRSDEKWQLPSQLLLSSMVLVVLQ